MLIPNKGRYLCEILSRDKQLPSGIWIADKIKSDKKDNVCRCLGVGSQTLKDCKFCADKMWCKKPCVGKGKPLPIIAKRGDIIHFRGVFGQRITYDDRKLVFLTHDDIIAIEDNGIKAVGSLVIVKLEYADTMSGIIVPDTAKANEGDFWGDVVSVGPEFPDRKLKPGDKLCYLRAEGYRFRTFGTREEFLAIRGRWCYGVERV